MATSGQALKCRNIGPCLYVNFTFNILETTVANEKMRLSVQRSLDQLCSNVFTLLAQWGEFRVYFIATNNVLHVNIFRDPPVLASRFWVLRFYV